MCLDKCDWSNGSDEMWLVSWSCPPALRRRWRCCRRRRRRPPGSRRSFARCSGPLDPTFWLARPTSCCRTSLPSSTLSSSGRGRGFACSGHAHVRPAKSFGTFHLFLLIYFWTFVIFNRGVYLCFFCICHTYIHYFSVLSDVWHERQVARERQRERWSEERRVR